MPPLPINASMWYFPSVLPTSSFIYSTLWDGVSSDFGEIKEYAEFAATLEVPRADVKECSKAILDQLPVVDFNIEDIPIEEGIALLYQRQEGTDAVA